MASYMDELLGNLRDLLELKDKSTAHVNDQIKAFQHKGRLLLVFLSYTGRWFAEHEEWKILSEQFEDLAAAASSSITYSKLYKEDRRKANKFILVLSGTLQKIENIMPEVRKFLEVPKLVLSDGASAPTIHELLASFLHFLVQTLVELINSDICLIALVVDQIRTLKQDLIFLITFVGDTPFGIIELEKLKDLMVDIEAVANRWGNFLHMFFVNKMDEMMDRKMNDVLSDLLRRTENIKAEIREYLKLSLPQKFRTSEADDEFVAGFTDALLENMKELLNHRADLIVPVKDQMEIIHKELTYLRTFIGYTTKQGAKNEDLKELAVRIGGIAHETEYVIDSFILKNGPVWYFSSRLSNIVEELKLVRTEVMHINDKRKYDIGVLKMAESTSNLSSHVTAALVSDEVVGFQDEATTIIEKLTGGPAQLEVISIVGMAGLGKTTLARKIYNDPLIVYHFDIRSWCTVSRVYQKRDLLLRILSSAIELTEQIKSMSEQSMAEKLRKCLMEKRYLIVMDDMWSPDAWEDMRRSFPDHKKGSRVFFTSRCTDVALHVKSDSTPHELRFLSKEECWNLLQTKVFQKEKCPPSLVVVGKKIAALCQGLPLAVVVIAGLLAKMDKTKYSWEQVAKSLSSYVIESPEQYMDLLEKSYKHLPNYLKPCFLYCGAFPEDTEISVRRLIRLWIAEGFVQKREGKSLEDVGEEYLMELIRRSLLLVSQRRSDGGVKACRIHDLLRDLCLMKAREVGFLKLIDGPFSIYEHHRRLCIHSWPSEFSYSTPFGQHVRSLLFSSNDIWANDFFFSVYHVLFICRSVKQLRVLDLGWMRIGDTFPSEIGLLVHLRYLAVKGDFHSIPPMVSNLWNLETLLVQSTQYFVKLPDDILNMLKLRHLHINYGALFSSSFYHRKTFEFDKMQTLSTLVFHSGEEAEKILRCIPNLRKLKCRLSVSKRWWNSFGMSNSFPSLNFLNHLESLNIRLVSAVKCSWVLTEFPSNLKKITLSGFLLSWEQMPALEKLSNLEVLKLRWKAFNGPQWDTTMSGGEFQKLKFLKLESLNIKRWNASSNQFPRLERLVLKSCKELEEIPCDLGDIPTLQMIEVNWCNDSIRESALKIQETQQDNGNEAFKSFIYPPYSDSLLFW